MMDTVSFITDYAHSSRNDVERPTFAFGGELKPSNLKS